MSKTALLRFVDSFRASPSVLTLKSGHNSFTSIVPSPCGGRLHAPSPPVRYIRDPHASPPPAVTPLPALSRFFLLFFFTSSPFTGVSLHRPKTFFLYSLEIPLPAPLNRPQSPYPFLRPSPLARYRLPPQSSLPMSYPPIVTTLYRRGETSYSHGQKP